MGPAIPRLVGQNCIRKVADCDPESKLFALGPTQVPILSSLNDFETWKYKIKCALGCFCPAIYHSYQKPMRAVGE